ncbi:MAG: hypothetical protein LBV09_05350 [Deferribacteraceae bacterium]|jgi:hypothetical protein|nr:hypothetical protein [Deferribacteraceae bacterium]
MDKYLTIKPIFIFALLLGRIPLWVPAVALIATTEMPIESFVAFTVAIILAKGYLHRCDSSKNLPLRILSVFAWLYIVIAPDGVMPMVLTLLALYALEYIAFLRDEECRSEDTRRVVMQLR